MEHNEPPKSPVDFTVLSTGSKGNAVRIGDVMVDAGISFRRMKDDLCKCRYLLYTHEHSDHFKEATFNQIVTYFPYIDIIAPYSIAQIVPIRNLIYPGKDLTVGDKTFSCFECIHDVYTVGYAWNDAGVDIAYATDTADFRNFPDRKFDMMFLEANYRDDLIEAVRNERHGRYMPYLEATERHASRKQCLETFYNHRKNREAKLIELHQSERFG